MIEEPDTYSYTLKLPKERIAVLIGTKGEVKRDLEDVTHAKLHIDSKEGDVTLTGSDTLGLFIAREIIRAIGRGFNPDVAKLLLKSDYVFELISLADYAGKAKNQLERIKGRVIGTEGKSRKVIEELTETYITVYGKTIGIIGLSANVTIARRAIESLISGSMHATVYRWLERQRRELKRAEFIGDAVQANLR